MASIFSRLRRKDKPQALDQDFLREAAEPDADLLSGYATYQDYYDGEHYTQLDDRARRVLEHKGISFCENFAETIVDTMTARMNVRGFEVASAEGDSADAFSQWCDNLWQRNRADVLQQKVFDGAAVKGDAYVLLGWDETFKRPTFNFNRAEIIKPVYDEDGNLLMLVKRWSTSEVSPANPNGRPIQRMNLYYPDVIEKYFAATKDEASNWAPYRDPGENIWPLPWVNPSTGDPLGINGIHFKNKPRSRSMGRSELHSAIPQFNALNKQALDLYYVMDQQGWSQRYATGVDEAPSNAKAVGDVWWTPNENASFGEYASANPTLLNESIEAQLKRIAARSGTPLHMLNLTGTLPSGESLKTAEAPLVTRIQDRQIAHGNSFEDLMLTARRIQDAFGEPTPNLGEDEIVLTTLWEPAESRNEESEVNVAIGKQTLGVSKRTLIRELGYDPDVEEAQRDEETKASAEAMAKAARSGDYQDDLDA